jgi:hypothetical protein
VNLNCSQFVAFPSAKEPAPANSSLIPNFRANDQLRGICAIHPMLTSRIARVPHHVLSCRPCLPVACGENSAGLENCGVWGFRRACQRYRWGLFLQARLTCVQPHNKSGATIVYKMGSPHPLTVKGSELQILRYSRIPLSIWYLRAKLPWLRP